MRERKLRQFKTKCELDCPAGWFAGGALDKVISRMVPQDVEIFEILIIYISRKLCIYNQQQQEQEEEEQEYQQQQQHLYNTKASRISSSSSFIGGSNNISGCSSSSSRISGSIIINIRIKQTKYPFTFKVCISQLFYIVTYNYVLI